MNKGDRPGADSAILSLQTSLGLRDHDEFTYLPKIIKCTALHGKGIESLLEEIENHKNHLMNSGEFVKKRNKNNQIRVRSIVEYFIADEIWNEDRKNILKNQLNLISSSELSPYVSAEKIISHYKNDILKNN
jgi:LAO/AO transport system kinase